VYEVVDENRRMIEWMAIEDSLDPGGLRVMITPEEWKGLTLLVKILHDSPRCSTSEPGRIVSAYDDDIEIVLLFERMLRKRVDWMRAKSGAAGSDYRTGVDCHLDIIARRRASGRKQGRTIPGDEWSRSVCIVATNARELPVTDLAATFVMWADSKFPSPPAAFSEEIAFLKGTETYEEFLREKRRLEEDATRRAERAMRIRYLEAIRRDKEEEEARILEEASEEIRAMGWRGIMELHRQSEGLGGSLADRVRDIARSMLDPEEG